MRLLSFILCSLLLNATSAFADTVIWQYKQSFLSLVPTTQSNHHPVDITTEKLITLLKRINYSSNGSNKQLFIDAKKRHLFAQNLSKGLSKANPQQDVRFLLLSKRNNSLFADAGRIFYQDGKLNIIFSELLSTINPKYIYGRLQPPRPWRDASRQVANSYKQVLLSTAGVDKKRSDWLVIDTNLVVSAPLIQQSPRLINYTPTSAPKVKKTLEQRLRKLKELKQKGLISDTIYQNKVHQILEAL